MEGLKNYLKENPRAIGAFMALFGLWLAEIVYRGPFKAIAAGEKELSISLQGCLVSAMLFIFGLAFLFFPDKMKKWGEKMQENKGKATPRDALLICAIILPGIAGYLWLKWELENRGYRF